MFLIHRYVISLSQPYSRMYANGRLEGKQEATSSSRKSVIFSRLDGVICHKLFTLINIMGTRWSSWLRHCATSRKVTGWNFLLIKSFRPHHGSGIDSASTRNEYQEYFLGSKGGHCAGLTTFMCRLSWNLGSSTFWTLRTCPVQYGDCFTFTNKFSSICSGMDTIHTPHYRLEI